MPLFKFNPDVDGSIPQQQNLVARLDQSLACNALEDDLRLWASANGLKAFQNLIQDLRLKHPGPWLTFLGSGDFHHLSALLIESLPLDLRPITLVLIDNHPDWFCQKPQYHCGNWLSALLKLPWIENFILVGQDSADISGPQFWPAPFKELCNGRITLYPYAKNRVCVPLKWPQTVQGAISSVRRFYGTDLYFETLEAVGTAALFDQLASSLAGQNVYLSIDKDCLNTQSALTDWDQGRLSIEELVDGIGKFRERTRIVGVDICGERAPQPLKGLLKRIDAFRLNTKTGLNWDVMNQLNEKTNLSLLEALVETKIETNTL
jgi:hypothetical protein